MAHFNVEEPGLKSVHLTGSLTEVVDDQIERSGCEEERVRASELLSTCGANKIRTDVLLNSFYLW